MKTDQTGVFYLNASDETPMAAFPREYRRRFFATMDRNFVALWAGCAFVLGGAALGFSLRELPEEASEQEILKIQERYAQLVLNQPKPKREEEKELSTVDDVGAEEAEKEKVDRKKESYADKQERRRRTRDERRARREKISKEVGSAGIFAAITAAGGSSGGSSGVSDLLGATDVVSGLEGLSVSGGTFATANQGVDPSTLTGRRGTRTTGVGIEKEDVGRTTGPRIASTGSVSISSEPPEISGDDAQVQTSTACIQSVINRERAKIKRVYESWLKRDPKLSGRIKVKFTIMPGGTVTGAVIVQATTGNSRFNQNVLRYISNWDFAKCSPESALEIVLPFVFEGLS